MLKYHIKLAWRNLAKNRFYTIINILGLVCGIAFVLVIATYIWQAYQVNGHLRNLGNQYLIQSEYREPGMGLSLTTPGALPQALKEAYPHLVADYYRIDGISCIVSHGDKVFKEDGALGDSTLLAMYGFDLIDGDATTAFDAPFSVVITEAVAVKYFGRTDAVGEALTIRNFAGEKRDFLVTGVMSDFPENSVTNLTASMDNTIFLPLSNADYFGRDINNWQNLWIAGFVELREGVRPEALTRPMKQLVMQHADERVAANLTPVLKPLSTYYLDDNNAIVRKMVLTLSLAATFILLMAIINFVNISVSKSMSRSKEIGMCKLMGSGRTRLTVQLVVESLVVVCLSAAFALLLYPALAPVFGRIMNKELPVLGSLPPAFYGCYLVGALLLGVVAGLYPALRLSAGNALYAIRGRLSGIGEKQLVRKTLLGVQFMVAIVVLVAAVVISRQVSVFFSEDLGYDKNYLITAQVPRDWSPEGLNHMETVRQELLTVPQVENISISYDIPSAPGSGMLQISRLGAEENVAMQSIVSDAHYADTYKIPMVAGDFFAKEKSIAKDARAVVINRQAAKALGYDDPEKAVGQQVGINNGQSTATISGITADFYLSTMHSARPALVWANVYGSNAYRYFTIRIRPGSIGESIAAIENKWQRLMPDAPFEYTFMDEALQNMYAAEMQLRKASIMATLICMIIVVLGVVGLVSLTIQQRVKEIGIRKVLGASSTDIIHIFARDFIGVYLVALMLACPIAYYLLYQWLADFHLRTELNVTVFGVPVVSLLVIVMLFISLQCVRAVSANPVDSLRDE